MIYIRIIIALSFMCFAAVVFLILFAITAPFYAFNKRINRRGGRWNLEECA